MTEITDTTYPNADQVAMLLANISQSPVFLKFAMAKRKAPEGFKSELVIDQLMDCFVKGAEGTLNKDANFDYLSYVFANLTSQDSGRRHLVKRQEYDGVIPIEKLVVFTEHKSDVRRKGVASTIKYAAARDSGMESVEVKIGVGTAASMWTRTRCSWIRMVSIFCRICCSR